LQSHELKRFFKLKFEIWFFGVANALHFQVNNELISFVFTISLDT